MGFLVCYLLASVGPLAMGALSDATGTLTPTWLVLTVFAIAQGSVAVLLHPHRTPVA
jgi:cyanate permease